VINLSPAWRVP